MRPLGLYSYGLLVDDDLRVAAAESVDFRESGIGGAHVIERTDAHPIKSVPFSVD